MAGRFYTCPGSSQRAVLQLGFDKVKGSEEVFAVGYEDFQEFINASADSCDINTIITRIRNGETELLKSKPGIYGDFRSVPATFAEVLQSSIDGMHIFEQLPDAVRKRFGSFQEFSQDAGTSSWFEKMGVKVDQVDKVDQVKESEVKSDSQSE